jgi:uncharacterized membrane protein (UPF0127 family)
MSPRGGTLNRLLHFALAVAISLVCPSLFAASQTGNVQFKKTQIVLRQKNLKKTLLVELAETPAQHEMGLMNRKKLPINDGMLFVFQDSQVREFWMKNTLIDLDIAYFDSEKKIVDIQSMKAITTMIQQIVPTYPSKVPAKYALEMNAGWFKKNKISEGATFTILSRP